jgi:hypothetical protein
MERIHQAILPEDLAAHSDVLCGVFGDAFDRHGIINETVAARILARVPKVLARLNLQFAELNLRARCGGASTNGNGKRCLLT